MMQHPIKSNPLFQSEYTQHLNVQSHRVKEVIFLGTGTSSSLPNLFCLVHQPGASKQGHCETCYSALHGFKDGLMSKNRRRNTSLLVRYTHTESLHQEQQHCEEENEKSDSSLIILDKSVYSDTQPKDLLAKGNALDDARRPRARAGPASVDRLSNVIIDCGKTFYESALDWFLAYDCVYIDGLLITHGHADAILGLDDVRHWTMHSMIQSMVHAFCDTIVFPVIETTFPYLVDTNKATGGGAVSSVQFHTFEQDLKTRIRIENFDFQPIPVEHGFSGPKDPLMIVGYRFEDIAYLSDVSHIPADSMAALKGVQILIIDALHPIGSYSSHFCFPQAVQVIKELKPSFVYLTGLSHAWTHDSANAKLKTLCSTDPDLAGISIQLAFDGLRLLLE